MSFKTVKDICPDPPEEPEAYDYSLIKKSDRDYEEIIRQILGELHKERETNKFYRSFIGHKKQRISQMLSFVKSEFSKISEIKDVYLLKNEVCTLWFFIEPYNESIEDKVFSAEYRLLREFNDLRFDFLVLPKLKNQNIPDNAEKIL